MFFLVKPYRMKYVFGLGAFGARKCGFKRTFWSDLMLKRQEPKQEGQKQERSVDEASDLKEQTRVSDISSSIGEKPRDFALEAEKEISILKDKYLRSVADFRNLQMRMQKEVEDAKLFAIQQFAKDLINSVDNLERALALVPEDSRKDVEKNKELVDLYTGLKMTETVLNKTLEKHGLVKYDGLGEKFNPNLHEAVYQALVPGKEAGTIFHSEQTGFILNGRVIRPAKVGVVKEH
ncbi:hypothetical protein T552_01742 [Pneumocystis carinii B80]|uniref:GrpE protein homolog n=1 Tax=Pneumocystis carinii (strain B80) TaxID=1408658 RepID=A0A0W4ZJD5_PNEC8|nr:hypothetical protein T552_01742 [Pneumocystis carinii B80]KTW28482.1 hypothetical protein T552_01742 [Pneumocystis carinii B80]